ncbi:hypothetical protein MUP59_03295 [Candidatus Bathyarchaeota archaeon]|nr:hypothetical protein [Candidatus Bathyarchaeota archaeon]
MPSKFLLSPSETKLAELLEDEAITSPLPEEKGADILLYTDSGLVGFQRKQIPHDFISSVMDGRFARLLPLLTESCTFYRLINEGEFKYWPNQTVFLGKTRDGKQIPSRFTKGHVHGILNDIEFVWGVPVRWTEDISDTVVYLRSVREFMAAKKHVGLFTRPKVKGKWYTPSVDEVQLWLLQGFGGVGPSTADKIIRHFGRIPLKWSCTVEELAEVEGVTRKKAQELIDVLSATPKHSVGREEQVKGALRAEGDFDSLRRRMIART